MGTGGSEGSGTGSVISELEFWQPMREAMAARGRKPIAIPGYPFVAEKDGWAIGMVDATAKDATAAFYEFDQKMEHNKIAPSRLLVAVFYRASQSDIETITGLRRGNRMGTQAIAGLIHLVGNSFYPPKAAKWDPLSGYSNQPDFKAEIGKEIQDVLRRITGPR